MIATTVCYNETSIMRSEDFSILNQPAEVVAPRLLGSELRRELDGQRIVGRIVETEAYDQFDAASHSFHGQTARTEVMFGPAGQVYVYFTYGMHYCMNVVTGPSGHGSAVLIRALELVEGVEIAQANRPKITTITALTNGPAKLCQALMINRDFNGHNLRRPPLQLVIRSALPAEQIVTTTRIGISRDQDRLWRFYIRDNQSVSRLS
jgi:DNA-3-methyladenine glycosylase